MPSIENESYDVYVNINNELQAAGKIVVKDGVLQVSEDKYGIIGKNVFPGPVDDLTISKLNNPGDGLIIISSTDRKIGKDLRVVPKLNIEKEYFEKLKEIGQLPHSIFEYTNKGMKEPRIIEFKEGVAYLDGHELTEESLSRILVGVEDGSATLKYKSELATNE